MSEYDVVMQFFFVINRLYTNMNSNGIEVNYWGNSDKNHYTVRGLNVKYLAYLFLIHCFETRLRSTEH